jgi:signal transduction histidine kinase
MVGNSNQYQHPLKVILYLLQNHILMLIHLTAGLITVEVDTMHGTLEIIVKDSGINIPLAKWSKL